VKHADDGLKRVLSATPECLAPERFAEALTERERQHVDGCSRCQAELRLWHEFERGEASPDEGAAVQWIVAELTRRQSGTPAIREAGRGWFMSPLRRWAAAVAALALVATLGYLAWDREPSIREAAGAGETYRTGRLDVIGPVGDVATVPETLEWVAVPNAISYDIEVLEVDDTALWRGTSRSSRINLPPAVLRQLAPGKTVLWQVRARSADNSVIAESGRRQFRVRLAR
jgi:hypothetical protein